MKHLLLVGVFCLSLPISADTALCLYQNNGDKVTFLISSNPQVRSTDTEIELVTVSETISYPISDFRKFTLENIESKSEPIVTTIENLPTQVSGKNIVYDISGKQVLNLSDAKSGVYIIKTQTSTIKFLKK